MARYSKYPDYGPDVSPALRYATITCCVTVLAAMGTVFAVGQVKAAKTELAWQKTAIEGDGFHVQDMPLSFGKDVMQDVSQQNDVKTVLRIGECTVKVAATKTDNSATGFPEVHDYVFHEDGERIVVQNRAELATHPGLITQLGTSPCHE